MRAADALEKLLRHIPEHVARHRDHLLDLPGRMTEQELRWHLAQILPHVSLSLAQRLRFAKLLEDYFSDRSAIVRVSAMQALTDLAQQDRTFRKQALEHGKGGSCFRNCCGRAEAASSFRNWRQDGEGLREPIRVRAGLPIGR